MGTQVLDQRRNGCLTIFLDFSGPRKKWAQMGPNGARSCCFPTSPDIADILVDTDFDFENLNFLDFLDPRFLDFQIPGFLDSRLSSSYIFRGGTEVRRM